jgi:Domain of unknown function (DUF4136)
MECSKIVTTVIFFTVLIASCSTPAFVQKDDAVNFSDLKTYMWIDTRENESDVSKRGMAYADISIHNAVNGQLNSRGWKEVTDNPDILISYDVLVERTTEVQREPVYSQPFTRSYYNPYSKRWSTMYYPSQFQGYQVYDTPVKEGTITITMVDAKTDKNIFQGWTTERMASSGITDTEIRRSVRNIFKKSS